MIIYSYSDPNKPNDLSLTVTKQGIELYCYSVFDKNTWESDTYTSKPFSIENFKLLLKSLQHSGKGSIRENKQELIVEKSKAGFYKLQFDGGSGNHFSLPNIPIKSIDDLCNKLEDFASRMEKN